TTDQTPKPPECDRVFALFIAGTQDKPLAKAILASTQSVEKLFEVDQLKQKLGDRRRTIEGPEATPENILKICEGLDLRKNDSVFVSYCGHGGTYKGKGHCLLPQAARDQDGKFSPGTPLPRNDVVAALMSKSPRFICFVTDACAGLVEGKFPESTAYQT